MGSGFRFSQRPFVRCLFADPNIHFSLLCQTWFQDPPLDCNDMEELMRYFWFQTKNENVRQNQEIVALREKLEQSQPLPDVI